MSSAELPHRPCAAEGQPEAIPVPPVRPRARRRRSSPRASVWRGRIRRRDSGRAGSRACRSRSPRFACASPVTSASSACCISAAVISSLGGEGFGIRAQGGCQVEVIVDLMGGAVCGRGVRGGRARRQAGERTRRRISLTDRLRIRTWPGRGGDGLRQEPVAPGPGVADALRDSRQPDFQRRAGRIGQDQRGLKALRAQTAGDRPRALARMRT